MRTPRRVTIDLTSACNLTCLYCRHRTGPTETAKDLPVRAWLRFLEELGRCAVLDVVLGGGEPLVYRGFRRVVEGIAANRMRFSVLTNGTLVTPEIAACLAATKRCDLVQVSIDAARPEGHDVLRGRGSHAGALRGLRLLQEHGIKTAARVTLNRYNLPCLEETAVFLLEELELPYFSINAAGYLGLCRGNADSIQLTPDERGRAMRMLIELDRAYPGRIIAQAGPLSEAKRWTAMVKARRENQAGPPDGGFLTGCGCCWSSLSVRSDGVIVPCSLLAQIELGRVNQDDLGEIWRNHPDLARLRRRREIPLDSFADCRGCDYLSYCTGNCPGIGYNLTGVIDMPSPDACLRRYLAAGGSLPEERDR